MYTLCFFGTWALGRLSPADPHTARGISPILPELRTPHQPKRSLTPRWSPLHTAHDQPSWHRSGTPIMGGSLSEWSG